VVNGLSAVQGVLKPLVNGPGAVQGVLKHVRLSQVGPGAHLSWRCCTVGGQLPLNEVALHSFLLKRIIIVSLPVMPTIERFFVMPLGLLLRAVV
jgi:hypothetical protein